MQNGKGHTAFTFFWTNVLLLSRENVIFNKVPVLFIMVEFITKDPMEQVYVCS